GIIRVNLKVKVVKVKVVKVTVAVTIKPKPKVGVLVNVVPSEAFVGCEEGEQPIAQEANGSSSMKFQELNMMCTKMVPEEEDRVKKYIRGLLDNIQGNVIAAKPMRLQDANMTIPRSGMTLKAIEELVNRRVEEASAAYEAIRVANALEAKNQSQNSSDGDNGNGENGNGGNGNPNENNKDARPVA
nr:hypothetical protein [Tanacetum cinerariifolium]